jgi:hypothetical protein
LGPLKASVRRPVDVCRSPACTEVREALGLNGVTGELVCEEVVSLKGKMVDTGRGGMSFGELVKISLVSRRPPGTAVELLVRDVLPVNVLPMVPLLE